ncbi:MAG: DEAD/DEAH box helicase [Candidatus Aenigmarchaeota archaeon]|nr:DEAD/DEAH box helicase [Candidatus Aenigmarchaeota archaeon]
MEIIKDAGIETPTEIQEKTIPLILKGKDVIAGSATGSGKTLAFGSGIIQNVHKKKGIQSLIVTPTRELANQIAKALSKFSKHKKFNTVVVCGGLSMNRQVRELQTAEIVVGTPGRLLDHIQHRTIRLDGVKILVLDEADRMLDMGFIDDVDQIIAACPKKRQTLLFSATISKDISRLAGRYMKDPKMVSAESYVDPKKLKQIYYDVDEGTKFSLLASLLRKDHAGLIMVFCNTKRTVDFVARNLKEEGVNAEAIHGGFTQSKRNTVIGQFHAKKLKVMVCTDVAARGLDIKGVSHVYNYDLPRESKQYVHRIGRTARAGEKGMAINMLSKDQHAFFRAVMRDNDVDIVKKPTPQVEKIKTKKVEPKGHSFRRGPKVRKERRGNRPTRSNRSARERSSSGKPSGRRGGWKGARPRRA